MAIFDVRVADICFTEFNRLFEHFWPWYIRKISKKKEGFDMQLDKDDEWYSAYFDPKTYSFKRKQLFIYMKGVKTGYPFGNNTFLAEVQ